MSPQEEVINTCLSIVGDESSEENGQMTSMPLLQIIALPWLKI
jgi:hypothetical protein